MPNEPQKTAGRKRQPRIKKTQPKEGGQVKEPRVPLEAEERGYRRPKRPTRAAFSKKPCAVVMFSWAPSLFGDGWDEIADRDFQHVSPTRTHDVAGKQLTEAAIYFEAQDSWAKDDWDEHKDLRHATLLVTDTRPDHLDISKIMLRGGTAKWRTEVRQAILDNPTIIFSKTKREHIEDEGKVKKQRSKQQGAVTATPKKRVRKKTAAAVQPEQETAEAPKRRPRKRVARKAQV